MANKMKAGDLLTKKVKTYATQVGLSIDDIDPAAALEITIMSGASHKVLERRLAAAGF